MDKEKSGHYEQYRLFVPCVDARACELDGLHEHEQECRALHNHPRRLVAYLWPPMGVGQIAIARLEEEKGYEHYNCQDGHHRHH